MEHVSIPFLVREENPSPTEFIMFIRVMFAVACLLTTGCQIMDGFSDPDSMEGCCQTETPLSQEDEDSIRFIFELVEEAVVTNRFDEPFFRQFWTEDGWNHDGRFVFDHLEPHSFMVINSMKEFDHSVWIIETDVINAVTYRHEGSIQIMMVQGERFLSFHRANF